MAVVTTRDMATKFCRAAALDRTHHLHLVETDVAGIGRTPCRPMVTEYIRNLQSWTGHVRRRLLRRLVPLGPQQRQLIKWARHIADDVACNLGVKRRRLKLCVTEQYLDDADIDTLLHKMSGE